VYGQAQAAEVRRMSLVRRTVIFFIWTVDFIGNLLARDGVSADWPTITQHDHRTTPRQ
jgi:hypothetical protein